VDVKLNDDGVAARDDDDATKPVALISLTVSLIEAVGRDETENLMIALSVSPL
jgi:hypothetical protein